jgi:hypothetical protein
MGPLRREAESFLIEQIREYSHGAVGPQEDASTMNPASISNTMLQKLNNIQNKQMFLSK